MIRAAFGKVIPRAFNVKNFRTFAEGTQIAPKSGDAKSNEQISFYRDGELVKRNFLTLKTTEDIEG
jgi:hypothetical protein